MTQATEKEISEIYFANYKINWRDNPYMEDDEVNAMVSEILGIIKKNGLTIGQAQDLFDGCKDFVLMLPLNI